MKNQNKNKPRGFTLLEIIVTLGIMVIGLLGVTQMTILFLQINADQKAHVTAIALANEKLELIRNLPYNSIGTVGGVPAGNLVQNESITNNSIDFNVKTEIIYIDDPFDGLITTTGSSGSIYSTSNNEILYYWDMNSNTNDIAPNIGSGTLSFVGTTLDTGYQGNGVNISGTDQITTSANSNIDPDRGRIGIWYKPDLADTSNNERLVDISTDAGYLFIRRRSNERLQFSYGTNSGSAQSEALVWNPGQWYFIEAAWDTNYKQIWRDGVPLDTDESITGPPTFQNQMNIGNRGDTSEILRGTLDELYILNEPHKYEIWGYNQFNPYTSSNPQTTFYWNMDSGDSTQIPQVGAGTITVGGGYSVYDPAVKNAGLNLSNDGSDNDYAYIPSDSNIDFGHGRISFWFKPRNNTISSSNDYILTATGCSDGSFQLIREHDESIAFNYGSSSNNVALDSISLPWDQNWWYLMEIAFDDANDSISVLVNGVEVTSSNSIVIDAPVGCSGLYLSNISPSSNQNGDGRFDEMYILNEPYPSSSSASDTLNTDYKRAKITVSWTGNKSDKEVFLITDIAPPGIETTAGGGTIIINTIDASGLPVAEATVEVINNTIDPPVNLTLTSNVSGQLIIPGAPATSTSYQITVSKSGYSTDYTASATSTYITPVRDHLSVIESQATEASFIIDRVSTLNISTVSQTLPVNFQLNNDDSSEDQTTPAVAVAPTYIYTTWRDYRDSANYLNYSQKYSYTGVDQWISDVASTNQSPIHNPRITIDSSDNQYIIWSDASDGDSDIYIQKISAAGVIQFINPIKINNDTVSIEQINPDIIFYNNELYVVWEDQRNDGGDIYFNKVSTTGTVSFGSDIQVNSDSGTNTQTNPKILVDDYGFVYISWLDNRNGAIDIYLDKLTNNGANEWGLEIVINSNAATNISSFDMTQNNDAETSVIWTDNRNSNYDIFFQSIASSSAPLFGTDQSITTSSQSDNQAAVKIDTTDSGDFIIGWQDDRGTDQNIYVLRTQNDGTNLWTNDIRINLETNGDQLLSDVLVYDSDKIIAVWDDYSQGDANVWAGTLNYNGIETPVPFVDFTLTGTKLTHQSPDKVKFEQNYTTGAAGTLAITNLEWDTYTITITEPGLSLSSSVPAIPISINPNATESIKLIVD